MASPAVLALIVGASQKAGSARVLTAAVTAGHWAWCSAA